MKTLHQLLPLALLVAAAQLASAAVPSTINYQGRLTNAAGVPQSGSKAMSLKIFDAATSGTLLYAETVGSVAVDTNGVYGFQFGASGSSSTLVTETLATTNGSLSTFQSVLVNSPIIAGSVSVADGTYTWNQSAGSSNDNDFGAVYNTSLRRVTVNYYSAAPAAGQTLTATYRYSTSGISGALATGAEQWLELTVDGVAQSPRQKVLAVPFAVNAQRAVTAISLESKIKTCQLSSYIAGNVYKRLPASVSPGYGNMPTGDGGFRLIDINTSVVHELAADVVISAGTLISYPPTATVELAAYSKTGARTVVASMSRYTSGRLSIVGTFILDQSQNEYSVECSIGQSLVLVIDGRGAR